MFKRCVTIQKRLKHDDRTSVGTEGRLLIACRVIVWPSSTTPRFKIVLCLLAVRECLLKSEGQVPFFQIYCSKETLVRSDENKSTMTRTWMHVFLAIKP